MKQSSQYQQEPISHPEKAGEKVNTDMLQAWTLVINSLLININPDQLPLTTIMYYQNDKQVTTHSVYHQ